MYGVIGLVMMIVLLFVALDLFYRVIESVSDPENQN